MVFLHQVHADWYTLFEEYFMFWPACIWPRPPGQLLPIAVHDSQHKSLRTVIGSTKKLSLNSHTSRQSVRGVTCSKMHCRYMEFRKTLQSLDLYSVLPSSNLIPHQLQHKDMTEARCTDCNTDGSGFGLNLLEGETTLLPYRKNVENLEAYRGSLWFQSILRSLATERSRLLAPCSPCFVPSSSS